MWKTLAGCHNLNKPKPVTVYDTVNPKSVTTDELYGHMTLSKDWKDGVLSVIMRNMSKNVSPYTSSQTGKWVVLDGDIDVRHSIYKSDLLLFVLVFLCRLCGLSP